MTKQNPTVERTLGMREFLEAASAGGGFTVGGLCRSLGLELE